MNNIRFNKDGIILALSLTPTGGRGWYDGNCVFCGKKDHMGVNFESKGSKPPSFKCFKCGEKGSLIRLLKHIGRMDLMSGHGTPKPVSEQSLKVNSILNLDVTPEECRLPRSYERINHHPYLEGRGFTSIQYHMFGVAVARDDIRYKNDYVLFTIMDEGRPVGILGRSLWDEDRMNSHNAKVKESGMGTKHSKYKNMSVEFNKMLFGIDEIIEGVTHTAIAVEGVTDKASVDRGLNLYENDEMKCVVTFGKDMSSEQIVKLIKKGIRHLVLFYDPDAISAIKENLSRAFTYFDTVRCAVIRFPKDAGDMSPMEIATCMNEQVDVFMVNSILLDKNKIKKWRK